MSNPFSFFEMPTVAPIKATRGPGGGKANGPKDCSTCPHAPCVQGDETKWRGNSKVLIIQGAPSKMELANGVRFSDLPGQIFWEICDELGFNPQKEAWHTYAVRCPGAKSEVAKEACRSKLLELIERLQPEVIIPVGIVATETLLYHRMNGRIKNVKPTSFFGECIPDQLHKAWICPVSDPSHILRIETDKNKKPRRKPFVATDLRVMLRNELAEAIAHIGEDVPIYSDAPIRICQTAQELEKETAEIILRDPEEFAYDFETSGLKPARAGHFISHCSVAYESMGQEHCFSFVYDSDNPRIVDCWRAILALSALKISHNSQFELMWNRTRGTGEWIGNNYDSMLAAHIIKNTAPIGLKFQVYVNCGILGWDSDADPYLKSLPADAVEHGANAFNRIKEAPKVKMLTYNAQDSLYTLRLKKQQEKIIREKYQWSMDFFVQGLEVFVRTSFNGMRFDESKARKEIAKLGHLVLECEKRISNDPMMRSKGLWINVDSPKDLDTYLYVTLSTPVPRVGRSVDAEALTEIGTQFCLDVVERRKLKKIQDYLKNYLRESVDNVIHPFFNLHSVVTFRSSSDSPNAQNVPKRDKRAKKAIRANFVPTPGNILVEWDLKGAEVGAAASITGDPNLIKYQTDYKKTDMHRDCAMQIFMWDQEHYQKGVRGSMKNCWTFPEFYGSTVMSGVAENLWYDVDEAVRVEMTGKLAGRLSQMQTTWDANGRCGDMPGTYQAWCAHLQEIETDFWGTRFHDYQQWKWDIWHFYQQHGYVDLVTGFRCYGPLDFNNATNSPIQGPAFHINLQTMIWNTAAIERKTKNRSKFVGQIHDSQIGDIHPDDLQFCNDTMQSSLLRIREEWKWVKVPIVVEWEATGVDESWDLLDEEKGGEIVAV